MERRLSWCTVATLFVLLFVTTEALRGHDSQVDEQRSHTLGNRGSAKFDAKLGDAIETTTTGSAASTLRSRAGRERKTQSQARRVSNPERYNDKPSSKQLDDASQVKDSFGPRDRKTTDGSVDSGKITNVADSRQRASRRNDRKYLPQQDETRESKKLEQDVTFETPRLHKQNSAPRRVSTRGSSKKGTDQILDNNTGPSVFSGVTDNSRSRTGRKIQTAFNDKELKKQIPASRRFSSQSSDVESSTSGSRRSSNKSRGSIKTTDNTSSSQKLDVSLTESESIRVDIPLALATTDYPAYTTIIGDISENQNISPRSSSRNAERRSDDKEYSKLNTKESRNSERTKNRGRSNDDAGASNTRTANSRRGSSKFVDFSTPETVEISSTRSKSRTEGRSLDRARNPETKSRNSGNESVKSRSRGRSLDIVSRSVSNGVSGQGEIKRRSSGDRNSPDGRVRNSERKVKQVDNKIQDQDVRGRSRNKARAEVTTLKTIDVPTPIPIEATSWTSEFTTVPISEPSITTIRANGQRESTRTTTEATSRSRGRKRANGQGRNSEKEDYFNHGLGFRGRKLPIDGVTKNPVTPARISTVKIDNQVRGNPGWTLRRRPSHGDRLETSTGSTTSTSTVSPVREQINEIVTSDDQSINKESSTVTSTTRRGPKKQKNEESNAVASTTSNPKKGNQNVEKGNSAKTNESEESDNYPPDFKARILQLKNSSVKIPAIKSTPRTSTEGKKTAANLFSERSRIKLELARRLVKPELNDQQNVLDVITARSPTKLKSTDVPVAEETQKVAKLAKATPSSRQDDRQKVEKSVKEQKHSRERKGLDEEYSGLETRTSRPKKEKVISERTVTSVSVDGDPSNYVVETVTKITEEVSSMTMDATQLRKSPSRKGKLVEVATTTSKSPKTFNTTPRNAVKTFKQGNSFARHSRYPEKDSSATTIGSFNVFEEATKFPSVSTTTDSNELSFSKNDHVQVQTKTPSALNSVTRSKFQSNYPQKLKQKVGEDTNEIPQQSTTRTSSATGRHTRKKIEVFKPFDPIPKTTTESISMSSKRREYRPRTATYRRHSELPTTSVQSTIKVDSTPGVAITPKTPKYHASLKSSTPTARSIPQEPQVSVRISNDTTAESGITDSSNGNTGTSNIFNPTRSAFLTGNGTLLEQLRSTVAPLLNSLGNKTPIFASSYSNVNNGSSPPRITPNGSPPRFSARYKGAELFVRKPTGGYQATVPSITSSSTTPATPVEVARDRCKRRRKYVRQANRGQPSIGSAPPIDISSPGEPNFVTFYHAVETASVRNEQQAQGDPLQQRLNDNVTQVDSNATNGTTGNANSNNDNTSPSTVETASPQTPDINIDSTTTRPENISNENLSQDMESANPTSTTEGSPDSNVSMAVPSTTESLSTTTDSMVETNTAPSSELPTNANIAGETTTQDNQVTTDLATTTTSSPTTAEPMTTIVTPMMNDVLTTTLAQLSDSVDTTSSSTDASNIMESTTMMVDVSSQPAFQNRLLDMSETTEMIANTDTTTTTTAQNLESSPGMLETTTSVNTESLTLQTSLGSVDSSTVLTENSSSMETSTESIESNTIEQSDVSSSTVMSTSELDDLMSTTPIRVTTTDLPIVTTFRTRLIDFAQDILSRLQTAIGSTTLQYDLTTTPATTTTIRIGMVPPELLADLDTSTTLSTQTESTTMTQVVQQDVTTESTTTSTNGDMTPSSDAQSELRETTTETSMLMDSLGSDVSTQEAVTSDAVGSTTSSPTDLEINTQEIETSTTANAESSDLSLNVELVISPRNDSSVNTIPESPNNSTIPSVDADVTTLLPTALQDTTLESVTTGAPNDTLLTELMTIAKSLLSEAMNETQLPSLQSRLENNSSTVDSLSTNSETNTQESENSPTTVESSTSASTTAATQLSSDSMIENIPQVSTEVPSEQVDTTPVVLDTTPVREEETTLSVVLSESDIESGFGSTTTEPVESAGTNDMMPVDLGTTLENLKINATVPNEIEVGTTAMSESPNVGNINESSTTMSQDIETTSVSTANVDSMTLSYDFQSVPVTTQMQMTTPVEDTDIILSSREQVSELVTTTVRNNDNQSVTSESDVSATTVALEPLATTTVVTNDQSLITAPLDTDTQTSDNQTETTLSTQNTELTTQSTIFPTNDTGNAILELIESTITAVTIEPTTTMEIVNNGETSTSQPPEIIITGTVTQSEFDQSVENNTNQSVEMTSTEVVVNDADVTSNSPILTNNTELVLDLVNDTGTTTNQPIETTATIMPTDPPSPTDFINTSPTVIDRLQDATPATAQGTAGTGTMQSDQTTETTIIPTIITESPTATTSDSSNSLITESSPSGTSSLTDTTVVTTTMMTTTTTTTTTMTMTTPASSTTDRAPETTTTVETLMSSMQPAMSTDNVDINDNLISTEATTSASTMATSTTTVPGTSNVMSTMNTNDATIMMPDSTTTNAPTETTTTMTSSTTSSTMAAMTQSTTQAIPRIPALAPATPTTSMFTTPYMGRFGGSRLTPAPRFSPSSSTRAPLRDYHVYGIYPNKTIVRKRPEDNLIDARNVDSPYVIFGIFPDGRLVRKFPNGTIIPDPPSNPVEVVFSLRTTTTTNRPPPVFFYNQANQGTFNQYQAPNYYNNRKPEANLVRNDQNIGTVNLGLTGNAISGSNGGGADFLGPLGTPGSVATINTMGGMPNAALSPVFNGGGRIIQDREKDEASRSRESGGQRNSVYIGQDRFVNYWTNDVPNTNPRVVSVNINSVATAANEGPASSTGRVPSFDNLLNNQPGAGGQVTAPPGFPWQDPLDQIFGITTNPPARTASIASNTLDDSNEGNQVIDARPVNPFVEVFTPVSNIMPTTPATTQASTTTTTTTTTPAPTTTTTTTTTPAPTTTTTTTTTPAPTTTTTTTTTTSAPTTTTTTTTTPAPTTTTTTTTTTMAPTTTTTPAPRTTAPTTSNVPVNMQSQNAFGTTFDDLAFLNSLLQSHNTPTTQKTLNDVEQLLANKILSLALGNAGPTRSPKAIGVGNASPNSIGDLPTPRPSSAPIVIDLLPSSTLKPSTTPRPVTTTLPTSRKQLQDLAASAQTHSGSVTSTTTKAPVIVTAKYIPSKPATTTPPPAPGFGASLLQALFGGNFFGPSTTARPVKSTPKPVKTSPKVVEITQRPLSTTQKPTTVRTVNISEIFVNTVKTNDLQASASTTVQPISTTTRPLLNNPNPRLPNVVSSTYSPEEDAKFLAALLNAIQKPNAKNEKPAGTPAPAVPQDDEAFLRAILNGQLTLPIATSTASPEVNNAALLAALLKAQGIEPSTPATNLREQLQLASLDKNLASLPSPSTTPRPAISSSTTPRPTTTMRASTTTRRATTPKARVQTTTWSPSSTYPPPLFSGFSNFGNPIESPNGSGASGDGARSQVVNVALGATRAFSQFLGAALSGAAQQLQSFVRNGTRIVSEAVG